MTLPSILLADDHPMITGGLRSLLKDEFALVGNVDNGLALIESAKALRPDVIVTDLAMPGLNALEVLRVLGTLDLPSRVIVLTMHAEAHLAIEAFRRGALGYVLKTSAGDELITAIREVLSGRAYLTPLITKEVMTAMALDADADRQGRPTPRQGQVLRLIAEGKRMKEIAAILGMSQRTVESHKYEMMQALGIRTTAELIQYALQHPELGA